MADRADNFNLTWLWLHCLFSSNYGLLGQTLRKTVLYNKLFFDINFIIHGWIKQNTLSMLININKFWKNNWLINSIWNHLNHTGLPVWMCQLFSSTVKFCWYYMHINIHLQAIFVIFFLWPYYYLLYQFVWQNYLFGHEFSFSIKVTQMFRFRCRVRYSYPCDLKLSLLWLIFSHLPTYFSDATSRWINFCLTMHLWSLFVNNTYCCCFLADV